MPDVAVARMAPTRRGRKKAKVEHEQAPDDVSLTTLSFCLSLHGWYYTTAALCPVGLMCSFMLIPLSVQSPLPASPGSDSFTYTTVPYQPSASTSQRGDSAAANGRAGGGPGKRKPVTANGVVVPAPAPAAPTPSADRKGKRKAEQPNLTLKKKGRVAELAVRIDIL
jgi:hypothetical protein